MNSQGIKWRIDCMEIELKYLSRQVERELEYLSQQVKRELRYLSTRVEEGFARTEEVIRAENRSGESD
ncbi:MAG: hypothetical protein ABW196_01165 [Solirubrobacterales bacterium]